MTATPPKDSRLGKGYSYLFALALTILIASQTINIEFKTDNKGEFQISVASREINLQIFYPCVGLIATILGLPTDALALTIGKFLSKEPK